MELGFHQTPQDPCVYVHTINGYVMLVAVFVFVDDILLASRSEAVLATVKADFQSRFTMTDEGFTVFQTLHQQHYCETIVRDFAYYIGRRNYSEVPMQANNAQLDVPYEPTPEQARFLYVTIVGKIVYLTASLVQTSPMQCPCYLGSCHSPPIGPALLELHRQLWVNLPQR
jgi:hypothetical protein